MKLIKNFSILFLAFLCGCGNSEKLLLEIKTLQKQNAKMQTDLQDLKTKTNNVMNNVYETINRMYDNFGEIQSSLNDFGKDLKAISDLPKKIGKINFDPEKFNELHRSMISIHQHLEDVLGDVPKPRDFQILTQAFNDVKRSVDNLKNTNSTNSS